MGFMFEDLQIYQKSIDFAARIGKITAEFPKGCYYLSDQLNRASVSISTNLAEGNGRFTKADRKNFFTIARGSLHECLPLLELSYRKELISKVIHDQLRQELEIMSKMLSGLIKGVDKRKR